MVRAIVVGGGIGGLSTALALRQAGMGSTIFERDPAGSDRMTAGSGLTLWSNATAVLRQLGLLDEIVDAGSCLESFENRTWRGRGLAQWSIGDMGRRFGAPSVNISRPALHRILRAAVGDDIVFDTEFDSVEQSPREVAVRFSDGRQVAGDILIGADGLGSKVRNAVIPAVPLRFAGYAVSRALVPTPPLLVRPNTFVLLWGRGKRFGYYRVGGGTTYWFAVMNTSAHERRQTIDKVELLAEFGGWAAPVTELISSTPDADVSHTAVFERPTARRWGEGRVTTLGDAIHPMTFNVGQGACQAIEDAAALSRELRAAGHDPVSALRRYEHLRMRRTEHLVNLARRIGAVGRLSSPAACAARNILLRPILRGPARKQQEATFSRGDTL